MKLPIDEEWFKKHAETEGDLEIGAGGGRKTMTINLNSDEIAQLEKLINSDRIALSREEVSAIVYGIPEREFEVLKRLSTWLEKCERDKERE